ncbi:LuxR family transcriptional regulator [Microbacterium cremeum]|uniref:LuxR family transcriptional regulator n=1 Tax=Microbacterium cremeum TaxID=2782169 RepID=UPI001887402E|nr:LuxR family transcriptional regulator [Microbacterium cremeum]
MADRGALIDSARSAFAASDWSTALEYLSTARSEAPLEVDDVVLMARSAWWLGRVAESLALAEEAFRGLCDTDRASDAAMMALQLSVLWLTRGDLTIGTAWLHRARRILADLPEGPPHAYLVYLEASFGQITTGIEAWPDHDIERLADLARRFPEPAVEALAMVVRGLAELRRGDSRRGFALLDEAMLPVLAGDVAAEWAGDIYCTIIHTCHELADFRRMEDWTRATEQWCRQFGSEAMYTGICRVHRLELRSARGDWPAAEAMLLRECADLAGGNPWVAGEGFYQLGEVRRRRGDPAGAREAYDLARTAGVDPQPGAALLLLDAGDPVAARSALTAALAPRDALSRVRLLRAATEIALACDDRTGADAAAAELREAAERLRSPGFAAWSAHADGMLALASRDAPAALAALRRAEASFRADRQPYELARVLLLLSQAHELAGDAATAHVAATEAHDILARLGVPEDRDEPVVDAGPLTPREREVLALVAQGAPNRRVAEQLFISEKTVSRHLANIYVKIGVGSRTAAAAWWHSQGVADSAVS